MNLAPIVLFVYNRPDHTLQTLRALQANELASESTLYIYADGAKKDASEQQLQAIIEVRKVIRIEPWCKDVVIVERDDNLGLANSVINGVSEVVNEHGQVIVLEDDIVTGISFLTFMNKALEIYEADSAVYGVTGFTFPHSGVIKERTYFLPVMSSWGYGTWSDRWSKINFDGKSLLQEVDYKNLGKKLRFGRFDFYDMLKSQVAGKNDSWAVRFYVSMILQNGVFLFPNKPLLSNIGLDGSGVHCRKETDEVHTIDFTDEFRDLEYVKVPVTVEDATYNLFQINKVNNQRYPFKKRFKNAVKQHIPVELLQYIRRKRKLKNAGTFEHLIEFPRFTKCQVELLSKRFDIPDAASFLFMYKEIFQQEIYKFKASSNTPYIIDAGANIGLSVIYFKELFPNAEIVAFEPDENIFQFLSDNVSKRNYDNVNLISKGLWDSDTTLRFNAEGADGGAIIQNKATAENETSIKVVSLKSYLQKPVDFLKIDIEGAELKVLRDIKDLLHQVDNIFVEYHSFVDKEQCLHEIINILTESGFRLYTSNPGNVSVSSPYLGLSNYNGMDYQLNIFGFRNH